MLKEEIVKLTAENLTLKINLDAKYMEYNEQKKNVEKKKIDQEGWKIAQNEKKEDLRKIRTLGEREVMNMLNKKEDVRRSVIDKEKKGGVQ